MPLAVAIVYDFMSKLLCCPSCLRLPFVLNVSCECEIGSDCMTLLFALLKVVGLVIGSYRLGNGGKIDVYDGANDSAPQLVSFTFEDFSHFPQISVKELMTTQRYMFVRFTSPSNIGSSGGFNATYTTANATNTSGNCFTKVISLTYSLVPVNKVTSSIKHDFS